MNRSFPLLRFTLEGVGIACALDRVASVLTVEESRGVRQEDLAVWLGLEVGAHVGGHVALFEMLEGPPVGLYIGALQSVVHAHPDMVVWLPPWLDGLQNTYIHPAMLRLPQSDELTWLLDIDALLKDLALC